MKKNELEILYSVPALYDLGILKIDPLTPDASDRRYFRAYVEDKAWGETIIAMCLPQRVDGELSFVNVGKYLYDRGFPVPRVYHYNSSAGILLLEDCGDISLETFLRGLDGARVISVYKKALDICLDFELLCKKDASCVAFSYEFDFDKFMWEFDFFVEHMLKGHNKAYIPPGDKERLMSLFSPVVKRLVKEDKVFTHRDYHSRNIMVNGEGLFLLDFQDARLGPCQYDLASLLRDSYVQLPDSVVSELLTYYFEQKNNRGKAVPCKEEFMKVFDYMSIQRNLKALGTFAFQATVKGNYNYKQWIAPTIGYLEKNLKKYKELEQFALFLARYIEGVVL